MNTRRDSFYTSKRRRVSRPRSVKNLKAQVAKLKKQFDQTIEKKVFIETDRDSVADFTACQALAPGYDSTLMFHLSDIDTVGAANGQRVGIEVSPRWLKINAVFNNVDATAAVGYRCMVIQANRMNGVAPTSAEVIQQQGAAGVASTYDWLGPYNRDHLGEFDILFETFVMLEPGTLKNHMISYKWPKGTKKTIKWNTGNTIAENGHLYLMVVPTCTDLSDDLSVAFAYCLAYTDA